MRRNEFVKCTKTRFAKQKSPKLKLQRLLIRVGEVDVWVGVNRIDATHVSLTIQAPANVHIAREEILIYDDVSPLSADAG